MQSRRRPARTKSSAPRVPEVHGEALEVAAVGFPIGVARGRSSASRLRSPWSCIWGPTNASSTGDGREHEDEVPRERAGHAMVTYDSARAALVGLREERPGHEEASPWGWRRMPAASHWRACRNTTRASAATRSRSRNRSHAAGVRAAPVACAGAREATAVRWRPRVYPSPGPHSSAERRRRPSLQPRSSGRTLAAVQP